MMRILYFVPIVILSPAHMPISADGQDRPVQTAPAAKAPNDNIVVTGAKDKKPPPSPLPPGLAVTSRQIASDAGLFARCVKGTALELERTVVEGHPSDGKTRRALDRLIRSHAGCYPRFRPPLQNQTEFFGRCNPVVTEPQFPMVMCRAPYDRMAIVEQAFLSYAPHFMLSRADTLDKAVIGRFDARETARGKYRTPLDRRYYDAVTCMVQLEPESAVRLIRTPFGSGNEAALRADIIAKTSRCTQNAKKVSVDPPQFRGYVADALYHWTIAARGIETLVPAN